MDSFGGPDVVAISFSLTRRTIMLRFLLLSLLAVPGLSVVLAAPVPEGSAKPTGILVLDNCDDQYQGKEEYKDNLTLLDPTGKQTFRLSGFNNCESDRQQPDGCC